MMTVRNVSRFVLTGGGTIDANGEFHIWEHEPPVSSIYIIGSSDVAVFNLTVVQPAIITLHTQYCTGVRIADLKVCAVPPLPVAEILSEGLDMGSFLQNQVLGCVLLVQ